jgi:hypothetical protein
MKQFRIRIRITVIVFACLAATMSACGQGSGRNAGTQRSADTTQIKVQTSQDAQKALAQLQQDFATGKITQEQLRQKMTEVMRGTTGQRQPANQMSPDEIQRKISENKAAIDENNKAYDEQLGNMSWPPQDAFKRFGYYVPQPELDARYGVRIRWELKQGKGEDGQPSESLEITVRKKHPVTEMQISDDKKWKEIAKTLSEEENVRLHSFTGAEALSVAKFVQSCGAGKYEGDHFIKFDPQRAHTDEWQYFIVTEIKGGGGTLEIRIETFANARAQGLKGKIDK